jgi:hypothetical protein
MERSLTLAGSSKHHMLMATIYMRDIGAQAFDSKPPLLHRMITRRSRAQGRI